MAPCISGTSFRPRRSAIADVRTARPLPSHLLDRWTLTDYESRSLCREPPRPVRQHCSRVSEDLLEIDLEQPPLQHSHVLRGSTPARPQAEMRSALHVRERLH